jgi:hypothetical protein
MRTRRLFILACVVGLAAGCAHLPPGSLASLPSTTADTKIHVYLIRGFQDWYSDGLQTLKSSLTQHGIDTRSFAESQWQSLGTALAPGSLPRSRLVLIGFSYGADDVITIARQLQSAHIPVCLLITIDPVTPAAVPANVVQCDNFYQSNGIWDAFPWLRGVPLHREPNDKQPLLNLNLRQHPELLLPNTSHATIAANGRVHGAIVQLVLSAAHW